MTLETHSVISTFILANGVSVCLSSARKRSLMKIMHLTLPYLVPQLCQHDSEQNHCQKWWL